MLYSSNPYGSSSSSLYTSILFLSVLLLHQPPQAVASRPMQPSPVLSCKLSQWTNTKDLVVQFNHLAPFSPTAHGKNSWQANDLYHISRLYQPYFFRQQVSTTYTVVQKGFSEAAAPGMAPHFSKISILKHMLDSYPQFDYIVWLVSCRWRLQESWLAAFGIGNATCTAAVQCSHCTTGSWPHSAFQVQSAVQSLFVL
jgi:hypothetical protein